MYDMCTQCSPWFGANEAVHSTSTMRPDFKSTASPCRNDALIPDGAPRGRRSVQNPAISCGNVKR